MWKAKEIYQASGRRLGERMNRMRQKGLWSGPDEGENGTAAPPLNPRSRLKEALRRSCKESPYSRAQIAERMNGRARVEGLKLRRRVTQAVIDAWLADSKTNLPAVEEIPLFCWASGRDYALMALAGCRGLMVIGPEAARRLAWAERVWQARGLKKEIKRLEALLEQG